MKKQQTIAIKDAVYAKGLDGASFQVHRANIENNRLTGIRKKNDLRLNTSQISKIDRSRHETTAQIRRGNQPFILLIWSQVPNHTPK